MDEPRIVSVIEEERGEEKVAIEVVIGYGAVRFVFNEYTFNRSSTGRFGPLKKNRPLRYRIDRGKDCSLPSVPFWKAVDMARARLNEVRKARR